MNESFLFYFKLKYNSDYPYRLMAPKTITTPYFLFLFTSFTALESDLTHFLSD